MVGRGSMILMAQSVLAMVFLASPSVAEQQVQDGSDAYIAADSSPSPPRYVHADVAAIEQILVYNRFGSFNPFGMIFALRRDLSPADLAPDFRTLAEKETGAPTRAYTVADQTWSCAERTGAEPGTDWDKIEPGNARLKDCKRPRPMVLRANVGDILHVRLTNFLMGAMKPAKAPDLSQTFCKSADQKDFNTTAIRALVSEGPNIAEKIGVALCKPGTSTKKHALVREETPLTLESASDWPMTRGINLVFQGLTPVTADGIEGGKGLHPACLGLGAIAPSETVDCYWRADQEGTYFGASTAAPGGGQGGGGSLTHGLFAAVVVESADSQWFRSQVTAAAYESAWPRGVDASGAPPHVRKGALDYQAMDGDTPVLNMLRDVLPADDGWTPTGTSFSGTAKHVEIVHTDLNAIVHGPKGTFREFSVFFHDELKAFYTRNFDELAMFDQLSGVRDGFAINYGASGMGTMLLANRKGIGPAADCVECLYEEFFLTSWANGDPALLEGFPDDPSNVHHSYLNDAVVYRNFHAGPKETHVFHLHAHQWFAGNDENRGSYLDSQTVAPQQGFTYRIYNGGLPDPDLPPDAVKGELGWWQDVGSGNRNRTPGDSIFHCHLYPHFAQGMWALWRVHDVLEDGTRRLPDGQETPGFSVDIRATGARGVTRPGSVDDSGNYNAAAAGTPIPGIVPLPLQAIPVIPTYAGQTYDSANTTTANAFPGYPFYIPAKVGHRPPQPPMDIAHIHGKPTGGMGRHIVTSGTREGEVTVTQEDLSDTAKLADLELHFTQAVAKLLALGDMTVHFKTLAVEHIAHAGTALELAAMSFHNDGSLARTVDVRGAPVIPARGAYPVAVAPGPAGGAVQSGGLFLVNGAPPKPGAPFADPCAAHPRNIKDGATSEPDLLAGEMFFPDASLKGYRLYEASAVQVGLVTNRAGWHDPQGRINVLTADSDDYKQGNGTISPRVSAEEQPFFFRAYSGECIEFRHTNELPKELARDDFQVKTPTDTIGQHIHLVKFDVMAADGSANGFNYEDGTFAPDELIERRCLTEPQAVEAQLGAGYCTSGKDGKLWRRKRGDDPMLFQTTIQRWFADPMMSSSTSDPNDSATVDRTMKTVFTHDHFGPSSIQQHGFYGALVIEPSDATVCATEVKNSCMREPSTAGRARLISAADYPPTISPTKEWVAESQRPFRAGVGPRALVSDLGGPHIPEVTELANYREFALAVADFATLYDPRDRDTADDMCAAVNIRAVTLAANEKLPKHCATNPVGKPQASLKGLAKIACEAWLMESPALLREYCGDNFQKSGSNGWWVTSPGSVPAWVAAGFSGLNNPKSVLGAAPVTGLLTRAEAAGLVDYLIEYRRMAAGNLPDMGELARPIAPPERPESISVDHHDPYLVNYRGEPAPLRLGTDKSTSSDCSPRPLAEWAKILGRTDFGPDQIATVGRCSVDVQKLGGEGDPANLFLSRFHAADAVTPIIESYSGEKIMLRLIQGAQEVQHSFVIEGRQWLRNTDQAFAAGAELPDRSAELEAEPTLREACLRADAARKTNPLYHEAWRVVGPKPPTGDPREEYYIKALASYLGLSSPGNEPVDFWDWAAAYEALVAGCVNLEGMVTAQEIGISEHFEFNAAFRFEVGGAQSFIAGNAGRTEIVPLLSYGKKGARDSIYHFGSVDALWNGAWGITRVYTGTDAPDTTCAASPFSPHPDCGTASGAYIGDRLRPLPVPPTQDGEAAGLNGARVAAISLKGRMPCAPGAPVVKATIAAVSASAAFGKGLPHGGGISDPDGLFLTLVGPLQTDVETLRRDITEPERNEMLATIKRVHGTGDTLQPLVLPVTAGSCLDLTFVNLLKEEPPDEVPEGGLRDGIGDAPMPKITPLNVGAAQSREGGSAYTMRLAAPKDSQEMVGLRPSAMLSLQLGLPRLNDVTQDNAPFGRNPMGALPPGQLENAIYYAGRLSLPNILQMPKGIRNQSEEEQKAWLSANARWMPYAWGPLPLRAFGDVFGHASHGMVGTVLVLPQTYTAVKDGPDMVFDGTAHVMMPYSAKVGNGRTYAVNASSLPIDESAKADRKLRSFVLHWRDGLNLHDSNSDLYWVARDANGLSGLQQLPDLRLVPHCQACNDSYDFGTAAVDYLSPQAAALLRTQRGKRVEANFDLNAIAFPENYWRAAITSGQVPILKADAGEEIVIDIVHPGGRARQRAFVSFAQGYDDLFPGFGFPHAALVGPGKAVTASLMRRARPGCYLFGDGPTQVRTNGVWGVIDVADANGKSSCKF
jgi:manganese oxidase